MLERIYHWISGYVEFRVEGDGARLFTLAAKRGIGLWGFRREDGRAVARVKPRSYRKLRPIARRCQASTRITRKRGRPFQLRRLWRRKGLIVGGAAGAVLFWFLSGFVWGVEVTGTQAIAPSLVAQAAQACGVYAGARKSALQPKAAGVSLMAHMPELSWVAVNTDGCYVEVAVKEGVAKPELEDKEELSNIVAARAGLVVKLEAQQGRPEVAPGEAVSEGQLLIAGLYQQVPDPYAPPPEHLFQQVGRARGSVTAETYREFTVQVSAQQLEPVEAGRSTRLWLEVFGLRLPLGLWSREPADSRVYRERRQVEVLGVKLPLAVEQETVVALTEERRTLTEDQQKTAALLKLREAQRAELPPGASVRKEDLDFTFSEGLCILSARCHCWEEIGVVQKISVEYDKQVQ